MEDISDRKKQNKARLTLIENQLTELESKRPRSAALKKMHMERWHLEKGFVNYETVHLDSIAKMLKAEKKVEEEEAAKKEEKKKAGEETVATPPPAAEEVAVPPVPVVVTVKKPKKVV